MRKTTSRLATRPPAKARLRSAALPAAALMALVTAFALADPATAAEPGGAEPATCGAREAIVERLAVTYEEHPVSRGVTATGSLLEVLASPAGTWTLIVTIPNGPTCLVSSGEGWHDAPIQLAEDPAV